MATIENLSPESLVRIFSHYVRSEGHETFLRNIPRVCKIFNLYFADSSLWRNVRAHDLKFLLYLSRRGLLYHTQSLELDENESFNKLNLWPVLKNIRDLKALDLKEINMNCNAITLVTKFCPNVERLRLIASKPSITMRYDVEEFLNVCGPTLKHLDIELHYSKEAGRKLASGIAAKCPSLETLRIGTADASVEICELQRGCPKLKELKLAYCHIVTDGMNDSFGCVFKDLKKFEAYLCDFSGIEIYSLLKDSMDLQCLDLKYNKNLVLNNISNLPSNKVKILVIKLRDPSENWKVLEDFVWKWRQTLLVLELNGWEGEDDMNSVLKCLLKDNPNPPLESLVIRHYNLDLDLFEKLTEKCQYLDHLEAQLRARALIEG